MILKFFLLKMDTAYRIIFRINIKLKVNVKGAQEDSQVLCYIADIKSETFNIIRG